MSDSHRIETRCRLPQIADLELVVRITDQYQCPFGMRHLLVGWHQRGRRTVAEIARDWHATPGQIERLMRFYLVEVFEDVELESRNTTACSGERTSRIAGVNGSVRSLRGAPAIVARSIEQAYNASHRNWPLVAHAHNVTPSELYRWIMKHMGTGILIPSTDLKILRDMCASQGAPGSSSAVT